MRSLSSATTNVRVRKHSRHSGEKVATEEETLAASHLGRNEYQAAAQGQRNWAEVAAGAREHLCTLHRFCKLIATPASVDARRLSPGCEFAIASPDRGLRLDQSVGRTGGQRRHPTVSGSQLLHLHFLCKATKRKEAMRRGWRFLTENGRTYQIYAEPRATDECCSARFMLSMLLERNLCLL